jgi:hypothetical protein
MSLQVCKDRLDPLADRGKVHVGPGLIGASGTHDSDVHLTDGVGELAAGITLIAHKGLASGARTSGQQLEPHRALVAVGRGEGKRTRGAVGREDRVQPESPKEPGVRGAIAVAGGLAQRGALDGLYDSWRIRPGWSRSASDRRGTRDFDWQTRS